MITMFHFPNPDQAARAAAKRLILEIAKPKTFLLVSGGSDVDILRYLPAPSCPVGLVDERITNNPADRNAGKIQEIWPGILLVPFEEYTKYADYRIVITQGVGPDGHTAGIMADAPEDQGKWVMRYKTAKNKFSDRITVTNTFLTTAVDVSIVFACGKEKKETLQKILASNDNVLHAMKSVFLFTDQAVGV